MGENDVVIEVMASLSSGDPPDRHVAPGFDHALS